MSAVRPRLRFWLPLPCSSSTVVIRCVTASGKPELLSGGARCKLWELFHVNVTTSCHPFQFFSLWCAFFSFFPDICFWPYHSFLSPPSPSSQIFCLFCQSCVHIPRTKCWILKGMSCVYTSRQWLRPMVYWLTNTSTYRNSEKAGTYC